MRHGTPGPITAQPVEHKAQANDDKEGEDAPEAQLAAQPSTIRDCQLIHEYSLLPGECWMNCTYCAPAITILC
jgi:hypothetical protein